jgi:hypothetical protein
MYQFLQFPSDRVLRVKEKETPDYMRPNHTPLAVVGESYLDDDICDRICEFMDAIESYRFKNCGAITREAPWPLPDLFDEVIQFATGINNFYWQYELDDKPAAFYQTYTKGMNYQLHMDGNISQSRKLTAVVMLTDPAKYEGGQLELHYHPNKFYVPRTRGTIAVFQPWMLHEVIEVTEGTRQTLNLGFWGPPFR